MTKQPDPLASNDKKNDFLKSVILAAEKRRDAVESKASILLGANAVLLTAISALGLPTPTPLASSAWTFFRFGLLIVSLAGIVTSSLSAIQVLAPFGAHKRKQVMKVSDSEFNVYWSGKISEFENSKAYSNAIESLTEHQILEQLTNEAYNISCLVMDRYKWIQRAQRAITLSILAFIGLAASGII